ncbi:DUF6325 family protein [Nocardia harenae]|uniref:DUF6325 family protein n=1 Tax=Nocardia harenae TaxID=358707 RepID=UPI00082F7BBB|nr:DUF6325 family protein [Nocardia harenae]
MSATIGLGPVEFVAFTFPAARADAALSELLARVAAGGLVTVLDLIVVAMDEHGVITEREIEDDLAQVGVTGLTAADIDLVSDADLEVVRAGLRPGCTAVVVVYEQTWARELADRVRAADGEVTLHVQVPRDAVEVALAAAAD